MNDLVFLKKDDAFTDSLVIAEATENQHESVVRIISKHKKRIERFGKIEFTDFKSGKRGRPTKVYQLNEPQASLLITFLDNTDKVADFKAELVRQFYEMRKFIAERHTEDWIKTRQQSKLTRRSETDVIKQLIEYAKEQGSTHADMLYVTYSNLANKMAGIENGRDNATTYQLSNLDLCEHVILHIIKAGIVNDLHYKEIYKNCKDRLGTIRELAYLGARV